MLKYQSMLILISYY